VLKLDYELLDSKAIEQLKQDIKIHTQIVDTINKTIRIRILLLLWIYKEQSINELCDKLGKSWPTVTKHLDALKDVLDVREESSRGPSNKKIYSVKPNLLQATRLGFDFLKLDPKDIIEILSQDLQSDNKTLEIIKKIFEDLPPYHEELDRILHEITPTRENLENFYKKMHVNYYVEVLDEEEFEFYFKKYHEFIKELNDFREQRRKYKKSDQSQKHYALLDLILPIKNIQEARFKRFWKT
jgi:DNA-binding transcriptional ArsR family regulator